MKVWHVLAIFGAVFYAGRCLPNRWRYAPITALLLVWPLIW